MSVPADSYSASTAAAATGGGRAARLDRALADLLSQAPELLAAAVVTFDGLAMASALPAGMDEDRVAAMSAALLSLGEKAAQGLGRGDLSQVYVEGENGTVFLVSALDEAVLVAVAAKGAKTGLMLYEVRRSAVIVGTVLARDYEATVEELYAAPATESEPVYTAPTPVSPPNAAPAPVQAVQTAVPAPLHAPVPADLPLAAPQGTWTPYSSQPTAPSVIAASA